MPTLLLTGANRGIGLGFARLYLEDGWRVLAAVRNPDGADELTALGAQHEGQLTILPLDLSDFESITALGAAVGDQPIDVLLGNAAMTGGPRSTFGDIDYDSWIESFRVNTLAQMRLAEALVGNVAASDRKTMYFISSRIGAMPPAGMIPYRSSKSALNQVVKQLSLLLAERGVIVACGHPGFAKTRPTGHMGVFEPIESTGHLKKIIDGLTLDGSGEFYDPDDSTLPIVTQQSNPDALGAKPPDVWDEQRKLRDQQR